MNYGEMKSLLLGTSDPVLRLELLMDIGRGLPPLPDGVSGAEIKGCASRVEIWRGGDGKFYGSADSLLVRGMVAVLLAMKEENVDFGEFSKLGLNLGAARLNGAGAMIAYLRNL
ncbi:MAG: SufE family protein [Rickettsiales bacterium]|jgi:sulfur transfer protein SufE|nr:SufE family protein [Rickettsiales bacterium]